jgi:hypothetical protein
MRIRIQIQIQGVGDQKFDKFTAENFLLFLFYVQVTVFIPQKSTSSISQCGSGSSQPKWMQIRIHNIDCFWDDVKSEEWQIKQ